MPNRTDATSEHDPARGLRPVLFVFGSFEFRDWPARLRKHGQSVPVQPQPARCLELLLRRAGDVVERDEIRDHIWGRETHLEHDQGINYIIKKLREALSDDPAEPAFIETVPRRGYRFVAPVSRRPAPAESERDAERAPPTPAARPGRRAILVVLVSLVALFAAYQWWSAGRERRPARPGLPMATRPVTSEPGLERQPDLSPDGLRVAYAAWAGSGSSWKIFVRQLEDGRALQVTFGPGFDGRPRWLPDGDRLAFVRIRGEDDCRVLVVGILGGRERVVGSCGRTQIPDLAVSPDGEWLAHPTAPAGEGPRGLSLLSLVDGESRILTEPIGEDADAFPAFSPDGRRLAFLRGPRTLARDVFVMALDGGDASRLTFDGKSISGLAWSSDSRSLFFSSNRIGRPALWKLSTAGGEPRWLPMRHSVIHDPTIVDTRLAFSSWEIESTLWRLPSSAASGDDSRPAFASDSWEGVPRYSPDGVQVAFASHRSASAEIWIAVHGLPGARQLTDLGSSIIESIEWSPDGERLLAGVQIDSQQHVYVVDVSTGTTTRFLEGEEIRIPTWSADGRHVLFASERGSSLEIWRARPDGTDLVAVTSTGGSSARETAAGLVMTVPDVAGLWVYAPETEDGRRLGSSSGPADPSMWGTAGDGLWYLEADSSTMVVLDGRTFEPRKEIPLGDSILAYSGLSLAPGSESVIGTSIGRLESDIYWAELPDTN